MVPFPPAGHTLPMEALAGQLRADGHAVTIFAETETTRWGMRRPVTPQMYASADAAALVRHMFAGNVADMARDIVDLAGACGAELIVTDVMMPGGGLAAELARLPWVSLSCTPIPELDTYRYFLPREAGASFRPDSTRLELGLPADDDRNLLARTSDLLHLIPATPQFAGFPELPANVALTGPFTALPPERPRPADNRWPTVAVTTSSNPMGQYARIEDRYLKAAAEALTSLNMTGLTDHDTPHAKLFAQSDAVITHGGWGTVSRALLLGLPLVLVPFGADQPYIAARCAEFGVGIVLPAETVTTAQLRDAIRGVIEEPSYRKAAGELAAEFRDAAPLVTASSMITSLSASEEGSRRCQP
ncbi:MAG TPA: glycosyltransferase [Streptosporangiaceae bacterium]|nr:glycosyltransferase [Streptosporangiaceae bacterium]